VHGDVYRRHYGTMHTGEDATLRSSENLLGKLKVHLAWDVSFWVAVIFLLGSVAWVIMGFLLYLPLSIGVKDHEGQATMWGFLGGTLFTLGSYLMVVEALNTGHEHLFGPAVEELFTDETRHEINAKGSDCAGPVFRWWGPGSWQDLGYVATMIQLVATTIFWISTVAALPGVISGFPETSSPIITNVFYWTPHVIGGSAFVISSLIFMIEVQSSLFRPNLTSLGWHVGLWYLIGAVGFTLSGLCGYGAASHPWLSHHSVLSAFWSSWAFLIGSMIQLWETLWREE